MVRNVLPSGCTELVTEAVRSLPGALPAVLWDQPADAPDLHDYHAAGNTAVPATPHLMQSGASQRSTVRRRACQGLLVSSSAC